MPGVFSFSKAVVKKGGEGDSDGLVGLKSSRNPLAWCVEADRDSSTEKQGEN